ncbi:MAG: TlpA family protein disulfide reductase [Candidatus Limnocylindria bacterium]
MPAGTATAPMSGAASAAASAPRPDLRRLPRSQLVVAATLPIILLALWGTLMVVRVLAPGASVGSPAPDFALADLDGNSVHLADLRGRPVIVNFWASWCVPCREEFPLLAQAAEEHAGDGLVIIGVAYDDTAGSARAFMEEFGAEWPAAMDPGGRVAQRYGIFGPPESFFIGRDGTVVARQIGLLRASDLDAKLALIMEE